MHLSTWYQAVENIVEAHLSGHLGQRCALLYYFTYLLILQTNKQQISFSNSHEIDLLLVFQTKQQQYFINNER